jgi:hypothetical protein
MVVIRVMEEVDYEVFKGLFLEAHSEYLEYLEQQDSQQYQKEKQEKKG